MTTTEDQPETAQEIQRGGTFVYGLPQKPDTPNVLTLGSVYSGVAVYQVYEYGINLDPMTQEIRPNVFTDWTIEEGDQPDVYVNVREGLTWNDGEDFGIEDVIFTYQYINENEPGNYASLASNLESVQEADNDWDVHLKLAQPLGVWESDILGGAPLLPKHKWEGKDYQSYNPMEENPDNGPVGLGPARLTRFDPDTSMQITLDNEYYYETLAELDWIKEHDQLIAGGPFLDKVNFQVYGSENAMTQAFLQGEIDTHYGSMKTANIPDVEQAEGQSLVDGTDSGFSYYGYNGRRPPLDDVTLRQAMQMLWDDHYWVNRLMEGYIIKGDFAQTPGYAVPRPDYQYAGEDQISTHPASNVYDFRSAEAAVPDVEGIRQFLTEGQVIDGSEGTYVGKDYPGSLSDVSASQSESKYDYTFGEVQSEVLQNHDGADQEIRVDGQTIPEIMDGDAITMFIDPPQDKPKEAKAIQRWINNLKDVGIPIKTQAIEFNTLSSKVYNEEDFDIYPMGWGGTGPFGSSAFSFFHSSMADDLSEGNNEAFMYNSTGYGLHGGSADDLLEQAQQEMNAEERNKLTAQALEKIYLDSPYFVWDYEKVKWPVNSADFQGFVSGLVDPAYANFSSMLNNIHQKQ
jgi:peptide/nickel transport system substrate-binding protein